MHKEGAFPIVRNVYLSSRQRDKSKYPSASEFVIDLPVIIHKVYGVNVRNYKYTAEPLINNNNRVFTFDVDAGTHTGTITLERGDYSQDINELLAEINTQLSVYKVEFTLDLATNRVAFAFTGNHVADYIAIPSCKLLTLLGYPGGICMYRTGHAPSPLPAGTTGYDTTAVASGAYRAIRDTDMILRITDVEAVLSSDAICHRATAILMSSRSPSNAVERTPTHEYFPLLQMQHRLQQLRVKILNSDGDAYDLGDEDASFMIEFYCLQEQHMTL